MECLNTRCTTITRRDRLHVRATPRMLMPRACCSHFITQTSAFIIYQVSESGLSAFTAPAGLHKHKHKQTHSHTSCNFIGHQLEFYLCVLFFFSIRRNPTSLSFPLQQIERATRRVNLISVVRKSHVRIHWRHEVPGCHWCNFKTR